MIVGILILGFNYILAPKYEEIKIGGSFDRDTYAGFFGIVGRWLPASVDTEELGSVVDAAIEGTRLE